MKSFMAPAGKVAVIAAGVGDDRLEGSGLDVAMDEDCVCAGNESGDSERGIWEPPPTLNTMSGNAKTECLT